MSNSPANRLTLSNQEVAFFKDTGSLILRDVLDRDLCARARDTMWAPVPELPHL
jgi:hypothetical protein